MHFGARKRRVRPAHITISVVQQAVCKQACHSDSPVNATNDALLGFFSYFINFFDRDVLAEKNL
jgi:hypothetical protein